MDLKIKIAIVSVAVVGAFALGRYTVETKTVVKTEVVEVEKKSVETKTDADTKKHRETVVTETTNKDGTKITTTKTIEDTNTDKKTNTDTTVDSTKTSDITKISSRAGGVNISALAGADIHNPLGTLEYGLHITKSVLGPVSIGVWGLSSGVVGLSAGLSF